MCRLKFLIRMNNHTFFIASKKKHVPHVSFFISDSVCPIDGYLLFTSFVCPHITAQNAHIIAPAIQNTDNINIFSISPIEYKAVSAYEKTVGAFYIRSRRKRSPCISLIFQDADFLCDSAYGCQGCVRIFKFLRIQALISDRSLSASLDRCRLFMGKPEIFLHGFQCLPAFLFPGFPAFFQARSSAVWLPGLFIVVYVTNRISPRPFFVKKTGAPAATSCSTPFCHLYSPIRCKIQQQNLQHPSARTARAAILHNPAAAGAGLYQIPALNCCLLFCHFAQTSFERLNITGNYVKIPFIERFTYYD